LKFWPRLIGLIVAGALLLPAGAAWATGQQTSPRAVSTPAQSVPPKQWARDVCTALKEWKSNVSDANTTRKSASSSATNLSEAKDALVNFLGTVVQDTDTMLGEIQQAGVPKVKDGNKIAGGVENGLTDLRNLFVGAQETAANLSTTDQAQFQAAAADMENTIDEGGDKFSQAINRVERKYKAAKSALKHPACRNS
jgi:hypothetical protein